MVRREVDYELIGVAFLITTIILGGILLIGSSLNSYKVNDLRTEIANLEVKQRSQSLGIELASSFEGDNCQAMRQWVNSSSDTTEELRKKVAAYEDSSKIESPKYETLKKRYMNLMIQRIVEVREIEQRCGGDRVEIIYFYSNQDCDSCKDQGTVLTYLRRNYEDSVIVYPLDTGLEMDHIEFMKEFYGIERYPSLVVDGEVYEGFQSKQTLQQVIENKTEE